MEKGKKKLRKFKNKEFASTFVKKKDQTSLEKNHKLGKEQLKNQNLLI